MTVTVDTLYRVWNSSGYGYEVGLDADGLCLEINYHEGLFSNAPKQTLTLGKEDAIAVAEALLKLAKEMK